MSDEITQAVGAPLERQVGPRCDGCKYWDEFDEEEGDPIGTCKRYPPQRAVETKEAEANYGGPPKLLFNSRDWSQPHTRNYNWCGEFAGPNVGAKAPT